MLGNGLVHIEKCGNTIDNHSLVLNEEVNMSDIVIKPVTLLPNVIELNYYANALTPLFAMDSIVCKYIYFLWF